MAKAHAKLNRRSIVSYGNRDYKSVEERKLGLELFHNLVSNCSTLPEASVLILGNKKGKQKEAGDLKLSEQAIW